MADYSPTMGQCTYIWNDQHRVLLEDKAVWNTCHQMIQLHWTSIEVFSSYQLYHCWIKNQHSVDFLTPSSEFVLMMDTGQVSKMLVFNSVMWLIPQETFSIFIVKASNLISWTCHYSAVGKTDKCIMQQGASSGNGSHLYSGSDSLKF
jgi:hypothetical protein